MKSANRERQAIVEAFFGGLLVPREALRTVYDLARDADELDDQQLAALVIVRQILASDQDGLAQHSSLRGTERT